MKSREQKRAEATGRQEAYAALSTQEKIKSAKSRPGKSERELSRLARTAEKSKDADAVLAEAGKKKEKSASKTAILS